MGNDIFNEQLVKKQKTSADTFKVIGIWGLAIIISFLLFRFIPYIGAMLAVLVFWLAIALSGRVNKEYEYSFTNGDLDIDVIYNKAKRKRIIAVDSKRIIAFHKVQSREQIGRAGEKVVDCSSETGTADVYALTYEADHKKTIFLIEPNEQILKGILSYAPKSATGYYGVSKH